MSVCVCVCVSVSVIRCISNTLHLQCIGGRGQTAKERKDVTEGTRKSVRVPEGL